MLGWASNNRVHRSGAWIWWNRRGIGRNCQVLILSVPGDVHNFLSLRLERKKSSITHRWPEAAVGSSSQRESMHHLDVRTYVRTFSYNSS